MTVTGIVGDCDVIDGERGTSLCVEKPLGFEDACHHLKWINII